VEGVHNAPGVRAEDLITEINRMPEKYRDALLLVHSEGLSHREAGEVLRCAESTVSWRVHEGKKKLKELLNKRNDNG
jgi:RNA polymerase sigma-70 factor (ECF subfamily)